MGMSLTNQDLTAIKRLIDTANARLETRLIKRIDELDDTLSLQTAAGFNEVHKRINGLSTKLSHVEQTVGRIERVQQAELERNDKQDLGIQKIRETLHAV